MSPCKPDSVMPITAISTSKSGIDEFLLLPEEALREILIDFDSSSLRVMSLAVASMSNGILTLVSNRLFCGNPFCVPESSIIRGSNEEGS